MPKGGTQMFDINESLTNWLEKLDSFKLSDYTNSYIRIKHGFD